MKVVTQNEDRNSNDVSKTESIQYCSNCGKPIDKSSKFCKHCGNVIK